tara:strand:+ start:143 stop:538 length:396 start_codon:yes stop_codon:yes gene_type:complete
MNRELKKYLLAIEKENRRDDAVTLVSLMEEESGYEAKLHGKIVGFGSYHYKYASGREGDAIVTGFSVRKSYISIYIMPGFANYQKELEKLGKHKATKCCLTINKLADVNENVLRKIVKRSVVDMTKKYNLG